MENYTKKAIQGSFLEMLEEQPLSQITVKGVIEHCDMNRNTFYYHFRDLDELLESVVRGWLDEAMEECEKNSSPLDTVPQVLARLAAHKGAVMNIYNSVKRRIFIDYLERVIDYVAARQLDQRQPGSSQTKEGGDTVRFCRCLFVGLALDWLSCGMNYDLVDFARRAQRLYLADINSSGR